nr:H-NS histone family protein [Castellaniella caeni]
MARTSYASQKSRLEKEKAKIEKQLQSLQAKQRKPIITSIVRSMRDYGITPEEIAAAFSPRASSRNTDGARKPTSASASKRTVPAKYRHPETQAEWTGRGRAPLWVVEAEAAGTPREVFLIEKVAADATAD